MLFLEDGEGEAIVQDSEYTACMLTKAHVASSVCAALTKFKRLDM